MDTKLATNTIRTQQWAAIIKDRLDSGLNVTDYCKQFNLSKTQYYYWLRKIRSHVIETEMLQLVEIKPTAPVKANNLSINSFSTEMTLSVGAVQLGINSSTSPELIKMVLGVIADA